MSATNTTPHYELPSFLATDKPAWLVDWNGAMAKIDAGIYQAQQSADQSGTDISALSQSLTTLSGTVDSQGLTISTLSQSLTTAIGNINTINSLIGNGTPTTTDQTIIGAINEINARTGEADGITYDNTDSGLTATNVQDAIDEVNSAFKVVEVPISHEAALVFAIDIASYIPSGYRPVALALDIAAGSSGSGSASYTLNGTSIQVASASSVTIVSGSKAYVTMHKI